MPGVYIVPLNQLWLWTGKEVTCSLTIGVHMLDDEGMIRKRKEKENPTPLGVITGTRHTA